MEIAKIMLEDIKKNERINSLYTIITETSRKENYLPYIYDTFYKNNDPEKVYTKTKRSKHRRKILEWHNKALEGYEIYMQKNETKRGLYQHLVDYHLSMKKLEADSGPVLFKEMFSVPDAKKEVERRITHLEEWKENPDSFLIEYPFFNKLSSKMQLSAMETDMIILVGDWILNNLDRLKKIVSNEFNDENQVEALSTGVHVEQTPSIVLNDPYFGIAGKTKYAVDDKDDITSNQENLIAIKKKQSFELTPDYKVAIDGATLKKNKSEIKTPDMRDRRIFDILLNYRDKYFQQNRRILAPLSDLMKQAYETDGVKNYQEMRNRLMRLGYFRLLKQKDTGAFDIRSLFSSMTVDQDASGKWYVAAVVSDSVYDSVLREQFINIYDKKVKELTNDLAYHLSFLIQKNRILQYKPNMEEIKFEMSWEDFNYTIRFNKRSKRENMDAIAEALEEIKEKDFIVKKIERYHPLSFVITCYALNQYELEGMNNIKLSFEEPIQELLDSGK